jgi:hypothetical protein
MKALLDGLIENNTELAWYARAARIAVTGELRCCSHIAIGVLPPA